MTFPNLIYIYNKKRIMKYVEFKSYRFRKDLVVGFKLIRVYPNISAIYTYFPFVTVIVETRTDEFGKVTETEYYELRNSSNQVIYITDADGIKTIYPEVQPK